MKYLKILAVAFYVLPTLSIAASQKSTLQISGTTYKGDTVSIQVWDHYFVEGKQFIVKSRLASVIAVEGKFSFKFDTIKGPVYFVLQGLQNKKRFLLEKYLAMPGDSISVDQTNYKSFTFKGRGSDAMLCRYMMDSVAENVNRLFYKENFMALLQKGEYFSFVERIGLRADLITAVQQKILKDFKNRLSIDQYDILLADIIGRDAFTKYTTYQTAQRYLKANTSGDSLKLMSKQLVDYYKKNQPLISINIPDRALAVSKYYLDARVATIYLESEIQNKTATQMIIDQTKGVLRDKLLTAAILCPYFDRNASLDSAIISLLKVIKTPFCREPLQFYLKNYLKGVTAYDFALEDMSGKTRRLSDFRGKKVVIDFWYTGCMGCIGLYKNALKETEEELKSDTSIVFMSIAYDSERKNWLESIKKDIYTSESIINLIVGARKYTHPVITKYGIKGYPTLVIIDKKGKIIFNNNVSQKKADLVRLIKSS